MCANHERIASTYIKYAFIRNDSLSCLPKAILGELKSLVIVPKTIHLRLDKPVLKRKKISLFILKTNFINPFLLLQQPSNPLANVIVIFFEISQKCL